MFLYYQPAYRSAFFRTWYRLSLVSFFILEFVFIIITPNSNPISEHWCRGLNVGVFEAKNIGKSGELVQSAVQR